MSIEVIGPHRAELVAEGKKLKCAQCGALVITFLDYPVNRLKTKKAAHGVSTR